MKKKLLCLLLCIVMMATLFVGCTPSENGGGGGGGVSKGGTMEAGYARVDVTPDAANSMPLAGLAARNSEGVLDPLYITCVAMKDGDGNIYLLYHTDFLKAYSVLTLSKKQISKETGVPVENIVVSATHNHSAPGLDDADSAIIEDYAKTCKAAMIQSAKDAIADLKPAKMYTSSKKCENMTFVRHYLRANGTIHGEGGSRSEKYVGHPVPVDDNMELIKFVREGGKDIVLMNWQGHPRGHSTSDNSYESQGISTRNMVLSDVHIIRKTVEPALDCHFAFYLGASGNVNNSSAIAEEQLDENYVIHGEHLGQLLIEAAENFTEVDTGAIKKVTTRVPVEFKTGGGTDEIGISAVSIGDSIVFLVVPYEMFSENSLELKEYSKFDMTFIVTCADNHYGYLPTEATFDPSSYKTEAYEVRATNYAIGTAEAVVDGYKTLLDQLLPQ